MSDIKLIKPKFRKSPREKRKEKQDKIGAGIIGGSILGGAAALYKTAKDKIEKDYGRRGPKKKKAGGLLIEPKFKKTPKNRKKDQFKEDHPASMLSLLAFPAGAPAMYGIGKTRDYLDKKKREPKKASPEIKAEGAKKGKMIRMRSGGMNSDRMTEKDIGRATGAIPGNKAAKASMNSDRMTARDIEAARARLETSAIRNKYKISQLEKALRSSPKNPDRLTRKDIEKASSAVGKRKGGMLKAKSGKLADAMKKLRDKAYEKSGKKYKGVGKFGKDEYLIQKPLPGIKKGKMIKLRGGGAAIRGTNFKGVF